MKKFLAVGLALTLFSCGEESPQENPPTTPTPSSTVVTGTFDDGTEAEMVIITLRDYVSSESDTLAQGTVENGSFEINLDCTEPMYCVLRGGGTSSIIFVIPSDTLNFTYTGTEEDRETTIAGLAASANNYVRAKIDLNYDLEDKYSRDFTSVDSANCIAVFDSVHQACTDLLDTYVAATEDANSWQSNFVSQEKRNIELEMASRQIRYSRLYYLTEPAHLSVPPNYFEFLDGFDAQIANATSLLSFTNGISDYLSFLMYNDYKTLPESDDPPEYQSWRTDVIRANFKGDLLQMLVCHDIFQMVKYGGPDEDFTAAYATFKTEFPNSDFLTAIDAKSAEWDVIAAGTVAPNFTASTENGDQVSLADLKGQVVFIDVWATWCGPCRAEIPSLKEIEHEFEGKNVAFLSVSIDDEKSEWSAVVTEEQLGGIQWFADDAWQSALCKQYLINSIPRFMVIGADGIIVDPNAPRPSEHDKLAALLNAQLDAPVAQR
jgi:thiol-disulfide isomerase/thioredoxin